MKAERSASQVLYGFLPQQTVDLHGGVWKVERWEHAHIERNIDTASLVRELRRLASPWRAYDNDNGFVNDLERGREVRVMSLNMDQGVRVQRFPKLFECRACHRLTTDLEAVCRCGSTLPAAQLHFVGYHECGLLKAPYIPVCKVHREVKIVSPESASAAEIRFVCPTCNAVLRTGFGFPKCQCGDGEMRFTVHRSASVFSPHNVVIINPPSRDSIRRIVESGGPSRALAWVLRGMESRTFEESGLTRDSLRQQLRSQGIPENVVEQMLDAAASGGSFNSASLDLRLSAEATANAENAAVTIAMALSTTRTTITDLVSVVDPLSELGTRYRTRYRANMTTAGVDAVELVEKFPILTGHFGYSRGGTDPRLCSLVPYREPAGHYSVFGNLAETEALFIKLDPLRVVNWLDQRGHSIGRPATPEEARIAILRHAEIPAVSDPLGNTVGHDVMTLIHSMSHRFIRATAVFAGIDRNSLSELLVPLHLGFFLFAVPRGNFVLGGLQAVFESELDDLLWEVVNGERRCALDPGCGASGGACMACLHIGEPSCRCYNRFLSRSTLFGAQGYLTTAS